MKYGAVIPDDVVEAVLRADYADLPVICAERGLSVAYARALRGGGSRRGLKMRQQLGLPMPHDKTRGWGPALTGKATRDLIKRIWAGDE